MEGLGTPPGTPQGMAKECHERLFVGEGNFTFTEALINKHGELPRLPQAITATEYKKKNEVTASVLARLRALRASGVTVRLGVDGTNLQARFQGRKFRCIHWNCPHDGRDYKTGGTRGAVAGFFQSAKGVLEDKGHIHMTLAQPGNQEAYRQVCAYGIVEATQAVGFDLIKMRNFHDRRYPGYVHSETSKGERSAKAAEKSIEFIFQKRVGAAQGGQSFVKQYNLNTYQKGRWKDYGIDTSNRDSFPYFSGSVASDSTSYEVTSETDEEEEDVGSQSAESSSYEVDGLPLADLKIED